MARHTSLYEDFYIQKSPYFHQCTHAKISPFINLCIGITPRRLMSPWTLRLPYVTMYDCPSICVHVHGYVYIYNIHFLDSIRWLVRERLRPPEEEVTFSACKVYIIALPSYRRCCKNKLPAGKLVIIVISTCWVLTNTVRKFLDRVVIRWNGGISFVALCACARINYRARG